MSEESRELRSSPVGTPEFLIRSVLAAVSSEKTRVAYQAALEEFFAWTGDRGEMLSNRDLSQIGGKTPRNLAKTFVDAII